MNLYELRINNFVGILGVPFPLTPARLNRVLTEVYRVTPVEIDESWMEKWNATKEPMGYSFDISMHPAHEYKTLYVDIKNKIIGVRCGGINEPRHKDELIVIFNNDVHKGFWLHRLQNIYLSFTQKEIHMYGR